MRFLTGIDNIITQADRALRTLSPGEQTPGRLSPAHAHSDIDLSTTERKHVAGLMRVNHAGEVCAQALYQGQALTAKLPRVRKEMEQAAEEEVDHLVWCEERLKELNARSSIFNPLWYGLSFGLGATAGVISDRISLGFVAATEEQVCNHLREHLDRIPEHDERSKAVLEKMLIDEEQHGHAAIAAGGLEFPSKIKQAMTVISKVMTSASYRV